MAQRHKGADWSAQVRAAMAAVPRERFLPADQRRFAASDQPLPIGFGQTNSQPSTVHAMLTLLQVPRGGSVLDLGCGSGWTTVLLAQLTGASGRVLGVERIPALTARASAHVAASEVPWAGVRQAAPGILGWPEEGPFDRILVSAGAESLPAQLVEQLAPGGILVIPVDSVMRRLRKDASGRITDTSHGLYSFVPLIREDPD